MVKMNRTATVVARITAFIFIAYISIVDIKGQNIIYEKEDSIFIEKTIARHPIEKYATTGERVIEIAKEFIGQEYVAGTLDRSSNEPLFISCRQLDCTTFAELVLAMAICKEKDFASVCRLVEQIRYRNGIRNGYTSRLHYISWWITDSAKQGMIEEIETELHTAEQILNLCFMSHNHSRYKQLQEDKERIETIEEYEKPFRNRTIRYIPKESINENIEGHIKDGDIITIVTATDGLDVSHMGFAIHDKGRVHLIHASSSAGKVICDTTSLGEYLKKRKSHLGIRIFRTE